MQVACNVTYTNKFITMLDPHTVNGFVLIFRSGVHYRIVFNSKMYVRVLLLLDECFQMLNRLWFCCSFTLGFNSVFNFGLVHFERVTQEFISKVVCTYCKAWIST